MFLLTHNLDSIYFLKPENDPGQSCDYRLELAVEESSENRARVAIG